MIGLRCSKYGMKNNVLGSFPEIFRTVLSIIGSTQLMALLFMVFAISMGVGTFIENEYSTDTARIFIYDAWWFEALLLLFVINFLSNVKKFGLIHRQKWPVLTIHLALVVIILGAFITRYYGFAGLMSIREGGTNNEIISDDAYLRVVIESNKNGMTRRQTIEKPLLMSQATPRQNKFSIQTNFEDQNIKIDYQEFIENARWKFQETNDGQVYLKIVETKNGERHEHYIKEGETTNFHNTKYTLNNPIVGDFNFQFKDYVLVLRTSYTGSLLKMATQETRNVRKGIDTVVTKALYTFKGVQFVIPEMPKNGTLNLESNKSKNENDLEDALNLGITINGNKSEVVVFGKNKKLGSPHSITVDNLKYTFTYGSRVYKLPFQIKLQDFIAEKYPGTTNSYSAFESKVLVLDDQGDFEADIYMNHVLDHKGYRFFQASFHPDEKGTILSVNHDFLGTYITYFGYFLLYIGLLLILFNKHSRFDTITKELKRINTKTGALTVGMFLIVVTSGFGQRQVDPLNPLIQNKIDSILLHFKAPTAHASKFGRLVVQDNNGRMKPISTYASEVLRKVSKNDVYKNFSADQVLLSMLQFPEIWYNVPLIYIKIGNDSIRSVIGASEDHKLIPLEKFFDERGDYKISSQVAKAYKSIVPNQFEKDFIEVDRRVNLLYNMLGGRELKIFPVPNDIDNSWVSTSNMADYTLSRNDSLFIAQVIPLYHDSFIKSVGTRNFAASDLILDKIKKYQIKYGQEVRPKESRIDAEILYNRYDVFKKLFSWYLYAGLLMLVAALVSLFKKNRTIKVFLKIFRIGVYLCFAMHTLGLMARWYISGHAPWSDAYESIVYISWATMLFGLVLGKKSDLTLAATAFVTSMILMVAHWNWLDPSIANLQPVLNSYWLMIHVAIIVASYGPFTLGMVLSVLSLLLMAFLNKTNHQRLGLNIVKLTILAEMALTIGLVMLTIGNFLGGQWANESWGRYWAWDPKETWALVSIVLYSFIIHMRLVPKLKSKWLFSLMGVLAFYSILMTYFGVNFYLSGLHSYAKGDNVVTPSFIYYSLLVVATLGAFSFYKQNRYLS